MLGARWEQLSGAKVEGDVAVARNLDGRLEIFARSGADLMHNWQTTPGPGSTWAGWRSLRFGITSSPIARTQVGGKLAVFARGLATGAGHELQYISQITPGGVWTTNWVPLFPSINYFDIGTDGNGLLVAVAAVDSPAPLVDNVMMRRQTPAGNWTTEVSLTMDWLHPVAIACNADGRMEIFSTSGNVTNYWEYSPGNWGPSGSLGGQVEDIVVASSQNGCLYLFGRGNSGEVQGKDVYIYQTLPSNGWSLWTTRLENIARKPVVILDASGALQVFIAATGFGVKQISQTSPNTDSWSELGIFLGRRDLLPCAAGLNRNGALELFAVNAGGDVFHTWQTVAGGPWIQDEERVIFPKM